MVPTTDIVVSEIALFCENGWNENKTYLYYTCKYFSAFESFSPFLLVLFYCKLPMLPSIVRLLCFLMTFDTDKRVGEQEVCDILSMFELYVFRMKVYLCI